MDRNGYGRGWKTLAIGVTALLIGALAVFWWSENRAAQARENVNTQMEEELRQLEVERHRLQQELDTVQTEYKKEAHGTGSLVLLFTSLNEQVYTDIYPQMEEFGFKGVLVLSEDSRPGAVGCMSRKQFKELTDAGWECCLLWDEDVEEENWAAEGGRLARSAGIAAPEAVYFQADTYDSDVDSFLIKKGFLTAVHHGEQKLPLILSEAGEGIWQAGAMPWGQTDAQKMVQEAIEQKGNLVFTVGDNSAEEKYDSRRYLSMLDYLYSCCESDTLKVLSLSEARDYRQGLSEGLEGLTEIYSGQKTDLESRLEDLNQRIDEIIRKYGKIR